MTHAYLISTGRELRPAVAEAGVVPTEPVEDQMSKEVANENARNIAALVGMVPGSSRSNVRG